VPLSPGGEEVEPLELDEGEELVVYRIVRVGDMQATEYRESFLSHAELRRPPRGPEVTTPMIYRGVSAYDSLEAALATARSYPAIGAHVARMRLTAASGIRYLRWGARGHLTLWGDSLTLSQQTVDTIPVDDEGGA
jgi:hypothetical protein